MTSFLPRSSACLAALVLAALPLAAGAMAAADAVLANVHIQVIDLDPNDGVAAAVTFNLDDGGDTVFVSAQAFSSGTTDYHFGSAPTGQGAGSDAATPQAWASASVSAGDFASRLRRRPGADAGAFATGAGTFASAQANVLAGTFQLTANTELIITAFGRVDTGAAVLGDSASAGAELFLGSFGGRTLADDFLFSDIFADGQRGGPSTARRLTISYSSDAEGASGRVLLGSRALATSVSAVPEPASSALWGGGLLLLAFGARRRPR